MENFTHGYFQNNQNNMQNRYGYQQEVFSNSFDPLIHCSDNVVSIFLSFCQSPFAIEMYGELLAINHTVPGNIGVY